MLSLIELIKQSHPFWGYRRVWATLRKYHGLKVNRKRIARLMRKNGFSVHRPTLKAKRAPGRAKMKPHATNQCWGTDMTKVCTARGWVYIVLVVDWFSKKIVGFNAGYQSLSRDWLEALDMGLYKNFPSGVRGSGLHLVSDNGCQPTSKTYRQECDRLGIMQIFTSYNNPKGNADTERMIRTAKEELFWLHEWESLEQLKWHLTAWVEDYNNNYLHSALGYKTPNEVHEQQPGKNSPLIAA